MKVKLTGLILILAGILLMLIKSDLASITSLLTWPFILFLLGAILMFFALSKRNHVLTLWTGLITALGLSIWGIKYVDGWPKHWSLLLVLFGIAVLFSFSISKNHITGIVGGIMVITGIFAYPGIANLPVISPITSILHGIWPVFVVILGLFLVTRK
ncbi:MULTISPECIES: hypothetical protein [Thermoactinomyces]|jgi:hypothetical protein|uniref:DUF5668 domain-containing protein n=1 Tax=Thermoactinomyces daqus TaxID=1329516 RepID=A0A7W1X7B2_9BACL|nr:MULTISPECIES: hypothetical protein [Thermoactinomyces]MBA4541416.1 hypothetical protein [Thermoactinomyces daqus]MBH8596889.1 hypothetical protein [Thermoactinomyces sp. CICC 10523]MBH8603649.1 hypothetical protein [Thermoactinomyces sp. CICC 10522]MBH8606814.1 hypothetical protein [Thermoactinomyces sp. CICC 10521]